jgi:protein-S-isoprenylcysteine O-methyltransferase Ste14
VFIRRLIIAIIWNVAFFGGILFLYAHTFDWWRAWVYVGVVGVVSAATMILVFRDREDLLKQRMRGVIQKGQPWSDRLIIIPFVFAFGYLFALIPLDVFRWHLLPRPNVIVSSLGLVVFVFGWWLIAATMQANNFAVPVVKLQQDRGHVVVDRGVYAYVRHPMYCGVVLVMAGSALWLESYAAATYSALPTLLLAVRILIEERLLRRELPGYEEYTRRVRYRLLPGVW